MNILVVRANPRRDGFTAMITDLFVQGATEAGATIEDCYLPTLTIERCLGCYHCWTVTPGRCVHSDAMEGLLEKLLWADTLVCATPLFHYSMASSMKLFFERTLPLSAQGLERTPRGYERNRIRYPEQWQNKKLVYIAAGAFRSVGNFEGLDSSFKLIADGMGMHFAGGLVRPESYLLPFEFAKPKTIKKIRAAFVQAGTEVVQQGSISEQTRAQAALALAPDDDHFRSYSEVFWEYAAHSGMGSGSLDALEQGVVSDPRVLLSEMARCIDPEATAKLTAVLGFDFTDRDFHFSLAINRGHCTLTQQAAPSCDLRITTTTTTWYQAFTRQITMRDALMNRAIVLQGDKFLFSRLERYFPPPDQ